MTVKELSNYLKRFPDDEEVRFIAVNLKDRIVWTNPRLIIITDAPAPVIGLELNESEPFDAEMTRAAEEDERNSLWIPVTESLPEPESYILVSFENFILPDIATYRVDDDGSGAFYPGDMDCTYISKGLYVNAWMPLPKPYAEDETETERFEKVN